jgi:hypothetical protein
MNGQIQGGWPFVIAAYTFTFTMLGLYVGSVIWRLRDERRAHAVTQEAQRLEAESHRRVPAAGETP